MASSSKAVVRKRVRKRKRRNVSSSSSSSSLSSSDSEASSEKNSDNGNVTTTKFLVSGTEKKSARKTVSNSSEDEESSASESSSDSDSSTEASTRQPILNTIESAPVVTSTETISVPPATNARKRYESPEPMNNVPAPKVLPTNDTQKEQVLKDRFRKFWMSNIADAFADDLNTIRNEPNLTQSRLTLLIDSLASGADVFSSSKGPDGKQTNEMEVVLGES